MEAPISQELLNFVDILSPNETELRRLTGMPTESFEQISHAVVKLHKMVSFAARSLQSVEQIVMLLDCHFYDLKIFVFGV